MERESRASSAGACRRWDAPPEDVIVLSSSSGSRPPRHPQQQPSEGAGQPQQQHSEPPEKVYYKTKLCEKYVAMGHCMYEDGCTFAHGRAELRPPLPALGGPWRRPPPPAEQEHARGAAGAGPVGRGRMCFMFSEKRFCHYGDKCAFPHASVPGPEIRNHGEPKLTEARIRSAPPRGRGYAPAPARAFQPGVPMRHLPEDDDGNAGPLAILSGKKMSGIYGDWPEEY